MGGTSDGGFFDVCDLDGLVGELDQRLRRGLLLVRCRVGWFLVDDRCLDLDGSGKVDKDEFRALLTALYESHYHICGLHDPKDPAEWFDGLTVGDYHTIARLKSNILTRTIFLFADTNRDGELNMKVCLTCSIILDFLLFSPLTSLNLIIIMCTAYKSLILF